MSEDQLVQETEESKMFFIVFLIMTLITVVIT